MRKKIILRLSFLIVSLTLLWSCRNEDLYLNGENEKPTYGITSQILHHKDIAGISSLRETLQSVAEPASGKNQGKIYTDEREGFTVNTEEFLYAEEYTGTKTYTFIVKREKENGLLENLMVTDKGDGKLYTYLIQYTQNYQKGRFFSAQELRDLIEKNINVIPLGIKKEGEIFGKIASNVCVGVSSVWVEEPGTACVSGQHSFIDGNECTYWGSVNMALPGVGGHYVYVMFDDCGTQGSGGLLGTIGTTGPYTGGGDIGNVYINPPDPCEHLKDLLKPAKTNLKPAIADLQAKLSDTIEHGKTLIRYPNPTPNTTPTVYENADNTVGTNREIRTGSGGPVYGSIHTHHYPGLVPMFSWKDVKALYQYYTDTNDENLNDLVMVLVCKDDNGTNQVYAIKIDNPDILYNALNNDTEESIPDMAGMIPERIAYEMDRKLTRLYSENYPNREKTFLDRFASFGISLYKADQNITRWDKLVMENGIVNPKPCN